MNWLTRLKNGTSPDTDATKPTKGGSVGFVATPPGHIKNSIVVERAANDAAGNVQPVENNQDQSTVDSCAVRAREAMDEGEIDVFTARLARFTDKGIGLEVAEMLADKLVVRDRDGDDRRLCLECANLIGTGGWRCGQWQRAAIGAPGIPAGLVQRLQRCDGFKGALW